MAKIVSIITILGCIHYAGKEHAAGSPAFDCDAKEAKRLIDLKVAAIPGEAAAAVVSPDQAAAEAAQVKADLLAAIAAAETTDALAALMPDNQPDQEIADAFVARMTELEGQ